MTLWRRNLLLLILAIALAVVPLAFRRNAEWAGTDTLGMEAIKSIQADYEPWFESLFSAADAGVERHLFGLQAFLGTLVVAGALGWMIGRYRARSSVPGRELTIASWVAGVAIVLAMALFFVQTEFAEIEGLISGVQGLCLGLLGFFLGYRRGERDAPRQTATAPTARGHTRARP